MPRSRCTRSRLTSAPARSSACHSLRACERSTRSVATPRAGQPSNSSGATWSGTLQVLPEPLVQRLRITPYLDDLLASGRGAQPWLQAKVLPGVQRFAAKERLARVVLREARRHTLQLLAPDVVARPLQLLHDRGQQGTCRLRRHLLMELRQLLGAQHVATRRDGEAAGGERDVAAFFAHPDRGRDVRLVRRVVLGEPYGAVGPEDLAVAVVGLQ